MASPQLDTCCKQKANLRHSCHHLFRKGVLVIACCTCCLCSADCTHRLTARHAVFSPRAFFLFILLQMSLSGTCRGHVRQAHQMSRQETVPGVARRQGNRRCVPPDSPAACMHVLGQSDMKGPPGAFQQGNLMEGFICTGIRVSQA